MKHPFILLALVANTVYATPRQTNSINDGPSNEKVENLQSICLFKTPDAKGIPYRIPAIATNKKANILK